MATTNASEYGRRGGSARGGRKARAARRNGRLGGRPRNQEVADLMAAHGRSRTWAYNFLRRRLGRGF